MAEGLAPLIRAEIWKTIRLVRDAGIATMVVDKTVSEVTAVADRVVVLVGGRKAYDDLPDVLVRDPQRVQSLWAYDHEDNCVELPTRIPRTTVIIAFVADAPVYRTPRRTAPWPRDSFA